MAPTLSMLYHLAASALLVALIITGFCRLVKTGRGTLRSVRWAFVALTVAAAALLWCLWLSPADLPFAWLGLLASIVLVQGITARHWRDGVPDNFRSPS